MDGEAAAKDPARQAARLAASLSEAGVDAVALTYVDNSGITA